MVATNTCLKKLREAAGQDLPKEELEGLLKLIRNRVNVEAVKTSSLDEAAANAVKQVAEELRILSAIERRNAIKNAEKRVRHLEWAYENFGTKILEPLETITVGSNFAVRDARYSVSRVQDSLKARYQNGLIKDLHKDGVFELFASRALDRDVFVALRAIGTENEAAALRAMDKNAVKIARVLDRWYEVARLDANREGANIGKLEGRGQRQTHDMVSIRKAGERQWTEDAARWFDLPRMLGDTDAGSPRQMLETLFTSLSTGLHLRPLPDASAFRGPGNLAKRLSKNRVIHFKDAESAWAYQQKYGYGNVRDSVLGELNRLSSATGLMQVLGTNPQSTIDWLSARLEQQAHNAKDASSIERFTTKKNRIKWFMSAIDGSMDIPMNALWARRAMAFRSTLNITKLGGILLTQFNDLATAGAAARHQGRHFLSGAGEGLAGMFQRINTPERRDLALSLGVVFDSMTGELSHAGSILEPGAMARAQQFFFKWNGSRIWTERLRATAGMGVARYMALQAEKQFVGLSDQFKLNLLKYGIEEPEWNLIRQGKLRAWDDADYVTPESLDELSDEVIGQYVFGRGKEVTSDNITQARRDLSDRLRNYFIDSTDFSVIRPDAKTRALLYGGERPGTWQGEFRRFVGQFKSFPITFTLRALGRELYGRGFKGGGLGAAFSNAWKNGNGEMAGLASLFLATTIFGYMSLSLRDMAKGKTPRDLSDPEIASKTMLAAMVQGGGLGIYGDFFFGEVNRFGRGTLETLTGPGITTTLDVLDLMKQAMRGDKVAARTLSLVINNLPFNTFYTRPLLDYYIYYGLQESISPGFLRRIERKAEREQGQEFFVLPSSAAVRY